MGSYYSANSLHFKKKKKEKFISVLAKDKSKINAFALLLIAVLAR